jgi:hypothetical protein
MLPMFFFVIFATAHVGFGQKWSAPTRFPYNVFYLLVCLLAFIAVFAGGMLKGAESAMDLGRFAMLLLIVICVFFFFIYVVREVYRFCGNVLKGRGSMPLYFWAAGLAAGLLETCMYQRISRLMPDGSGPGAMMVGIAYCAGFALSLFAASRKGMVRLPFVFLFAVPIIPALPWFTAGLHDWRWSLALTALFGFAACIPWSAGLGRVAREYRPRAFALWALGGLCGMYVFNWLVVVVGYKSASYVTGAMYLLIAVVFTAMLASLKWSFRPIGSTDSGAGKV